MKAQTFGVIYRSGGTVNFTWHRILERYTERAQADAMAESIRRAGRRAQVVDYDQSHRIGLPDTYGPAGVR